jgi:hypothetical protein
MARSHNGRRGRPLPPRRGVGLWHEPRRELLARFDGDLRAAARCTLCRSASRRMDNPSTRSSRLIAADRSTLDPIPAPS